MNLSRLMLHRIGRSIRYGTLILDIAGEETQTYGRGEPNIRLSIRKPGIIPRLVANPELAFGEAYTRGDLELNCEIEDLFDFASRNSSPASSLARQ